MNLSEGKRNLRLARLPLWLVFLTLLAAITLTHITLLRLPYYWDECAYYIPAAYDFFQTGTIIRQSAVANIHPPLPSILLAAWWHAFGFTPLATRILVCLFASAALTAVFHLARTLTSPSVAVVTTLLTALYPIWFTQSTLAHADIFAAAFTLWALAIYLAPLGAAGQTASPSDLRLLPPTTHTYINTAILFSLAALSKETAILTPAALTLLELYRATRVATHRKPHLLWAAALATPAIPLSAWYAYHRYRAGFLFGSGYLQYNATANLDPLRILFSLYHRLLHLTLHMNLFVATGCTLAALFMPKLANRTRLPRPVLVTVGVVLLTNWLAFSILGGALLTRYLLPVYPLILLLCVTEWRLHLRNWLPLAALTAAAFLAALWINPPYPFATEDNLTYADVIRLHQQAIAILVTRYPAATVLSADPVIQQLEHPALGYTPHPFPTVALKNFSYEEIQRAALDPGAYDTALLFSTKWVPPPGHLNLSARREASDTKYFDFHHDLTPTQTARLLHGEVVWQSTRNGAWAAVLHFPRAMNATLHPPQALVDRSPDAMPATSGRRRQGGSRRGLQRCSGTCQ